MGRRPNVVLMKPAEMEAIGQKLYGRFGWRPRLAEAIGVDVSTISRWHTGGIAISPYAVTAIRALGNRAARSSRNRS